MAIQTFTNATILLGTAWTGTAPGAAATPSGTINSGSGTYIDATSFCESVGVEFGIDLKDGPTFGSAAFNVKYGGLKSGTYTFSFLGDYAASQIAATLNTVGLGATLYVDVKPTSSARGTGNPSYVGAVLLDKIPFLNVGAPGELSKISLTLMTTGAFAVLVA